MQITRSGQNGAELAEIHQRGEIERDRERYGRPVRAATQSLLVLVGLIPIITGAVDPSLDISAVVTITGGALAAIGALLAGIGTIMQGRRKSSDRDPSGTVINVGATQSAESDELAALQREIKKLRRDVRSLSAKLNSQQQGSIASSLQHTDGYHQLLPPSQVPTTQQAPDHGS